MKYFVLFLILIGLAGTVFALEPKTTDYFSNLDFEIYSINEQSHTFFIPYSITNSKINDITMDCPSRAMVIDIDPAKETGTLTIVLPRTLLDSRYGSNDDSFIILVDGQEIEYSEIEKNAEARVLNIPFFENSSQIEIIVTTLISQSDDPLKIAPCGEAGSDESSFHKVLSPLKQYQNGVSQKDLVCQQYLAALFNIHGKFGCVTYDNGQELVKRGWANCEDQIGFRRGDICGIRSSPGIMESPETEQKEIVRSGSSMPDYPLDFLAQVSPFAIKGTVDDVVFLPLHYDEVGIGNALTAIVINVEKDFNEKYTNDTITVVIQGGETDTTKYVSDSSPEFAIGEKVFVFVADKEPESIFGDNYYVAGLEQGKFNLDEEGMAINKDPNRSLTLESLIGIINRIHSDE